MCSHGIPEATCSITCQTITRLPSNVGCPPQIRRSAMMYFPNCTRSAFAFISRQDYALGPNKSQGCLQAISPSHPRFPMPNIALAKTEPSRRRHLQLCKELDAFLALHVQIAKERFIPSIKRKPGHRGRHANIYSDHSALNAMFEFSRGLP